MSPEDLRSVHLYNRSLDIPLYILYTGIMKSPIPATEARNRFFEILNAVIYKGEEFIIEKSGEGRARIIPDKTKPSPEEIDRVLDEFKRVFGTKRPKYWGVTETPAWKRKERRYLKRLSKGIID